MSQIENLHFHPTNVPTQAHSGARTEREEIPVHITVVLLEPSLRFEKVDVFAEDFFLSMDYPWVRADDTSSWEIFTGNFKSSVWYYSR